MRIPILAIMITTIAGAPLRGQRPEPVSQAIQEAWAGAKLNIIESAQQMPEDGYGFRPVETVRTFGQILAHVAGANYLFCAAAKGEKNPYAEDHFEKTAKTRTQIVKAVNDSIAYCDGIYMNLIDSKAVEMIASPFGGGRVARAAMLINNTGHLQEHYGNLVTYFRVKGMVPPSSRRAQ